MPETITLETLNRDIDRIAGRLIVHRALLINAFTFISALDQTTPDALHSLLDLTTLPPRFETPDIADAMQEEIDLILKRIAEARSTSP